MKPKNKLSDIQFQKKLDALCKANIKYKQLLTECEAEYEVRYGISPSELSDDFWIDSFHAGFSENVLIAEIDDSVSLYKSIAKDRGIIL